MKLNRITTITAISFLGIVACTKENPPKTESRGQKHEGRSTIAKTEKPQVVTVEQKEQEIDSAIKDIPNILEKGGVVEYAKMLTEKISSLPDKVRQLEWCSKATNVLFSIECGQFKSGRKYNSVWAVGYLKGQIGNCVYKAGTLEDVWYLKLQYLAWIKRQQDWCTAEYAKIEPKTRVRPIPLSVANRARALRLMGESLAVDYRGECSRYEYDFWDIRYKLVAERSVMKVQRRFEEILGRPIRTPEQIQEDHEKAVEAYRREEAAEKSKTNRPPPLILIDSTK